MRTRVYVDGFNLYYGCLRGTPFKWVDLRALFLRLLPRHEVEAVKYFTARVEARPGDTSKATRQDAYLRALRSLPAVEVILGQFLTHPVRLPRADGKGYARVLRTEEKGSDVNLASHLLHDAHRGLVECVVIVSNDSDLAEPLRLVRNELPVAVGLISPTCLPGRHPSRQLVKHAAFVKRIRNGVLRDSQFPDPVVAGRQRIHKPKGW